MKIPFYIIAQIQNIVMSVFPIASSNNGKDNLKCKNGNKHEQLNIKYHHLSINRKSKIKCIEDYNIGQWTIIC